MNCFVVDYDPFSMESQILVLQNGIASSIKVCSDLEKLAYALQSFSHQYNLNLVKVSAPKPIFEELEHIMSSNYANNNIKLEIL